MTYLKKTLRSFALSALIIATANSHAAACDVGLAQVERGSPGRAIDALNVCLSNTKITGDNRADYLAFRGAMLQADGRLEEAKRDFEEVIQLRREPDIYEFFILADIYASMQRYQEAHQTLDRARNIVASMRPSRHKTLYERIDFFRNKFKTAESSASSER